jgi:hypothetical protein
MELEDKILNDEDFMRLFDNIDIWHDFGWYGLTFPILDEIRRYNEKNPEKKIYIRQIKQKWGRLVIYTTERPEYLDKMILKAKYESQHICELCGAAGKLFDMNGCVKTVCDEHLKAWLQSIKYHKSQDQLYKKLLLDAEKYADNDCIKIHELEEKNEE